MMGDVLENPFSPKWANRVRSAVSSFELDIIGLLSFSGHILLF